MSDTQIQSCIDLIGQQQYEAAIPLLETILMRIPQQIALLCDLGMCHTQLGHYTQAENCLAQAAALDPDFLPLLQNYLHVYLAQGKYESAVVCARKCLQHPQLDFPACQHILTNLGLCYIHLHDYEQAQWYLNQALALQPNDPVTLNHIAFLFAQQQKYTEAIARLEQALQYHPNHLDSIINLSQYLILNIQYIQARQILENGLTLYPNHLTLIYNLGSVCDHLNDIDTAYACMTKIYQQGNLNMRADAAEVLATYHSRFGRADLALQLAYEAHTLSPQDPAKLSAYLFYLYTSPEQTPQSIFKWHQIYGSLYVNPLTSISKSFVNLKDLHRCLKVGYVSGDFNFHSANAAFLPLLTDFTPEQFEVFAYANNKAIDKTGYMLSQQLGIHHWRDVVNLDDHAVFDLIQQDQIDILVDLSGHTRGNRLLVFARKPAPIQMTGLGWGGTTGMITMDYRVSDCYNLPSSLESVNVEKILRISSLFHFIVTSEHAHEAVVPIPCLQKGYITFGCGNSPLKLNPQVVACWANILCHIPESQVHFKFTGMDHPHFIKEYTQMFAAHGIGADRLRFLGETTPSQHRQFYASIDIVLDPFPYNGGASTLDALWMGRPVITLEGGTRAGISIMNVIGHPEWVAQTEEQYIEIATQLAKDHGKLAELALSIRPDMLNSHLCKTREFVLEMEQHYRQVWQDWCQHQSSTIAQLLQQAHVLYQQGQFSLAEDIYRDVLKQEPAQPDALQGLGLIAYEFGHFEPAVDLIQQAIVQQPTQASFYGNLGLIYTAMNYLERAIEAYEKSLVLDSNQPEIHERLGALWIKSGESAKALPHYVSLLPFASENPHLHNTLGNLYRETGDLGLAQSHYERTLTFDPGFVLAHFNLGQLYLQQHQTDKAKDCFKRALALQPDFEPAKQPLYILNQG